MMETNPKELTDAIRVVGKNQPLEVIEAEILKQRQAKKPKRRKRGKQNNAKSSNT